jgi:hypothetical protein
MVTSVVTSTEASTLAIYCLPAGLVEIIATHDAKIVPGTATLTRVSISTLEGSRTAITETGSSTSGGVSTHTESHFSTETHAGTLTQFGDTATVWASATSSDPMRCHMGQMAASRLRRR